MPIEKVKGSVLATCMRFVVQPLVRLLFRIEVRGSSELPARAIYVANHLSLIDAPILFLFLPIRPVFIVYAGMRRNPFYRWVIAQADHWFVEEDRPLAFKELLGVLAENQSVLLFPEGRMSLTGALMKIHEGAAFLALHSGAPSSRCSCGEQTIFLGQPRSGHEEGGSESLDPRGQAGSNRSAGGGRSAESPPAGPSAPPGAHGVGVFPKHPTLSSLRECPARGATSRILPARSRGPDPRIVFLRPTADAILPARPRPGPAKQARGEDRNPASHRGRRRRDDSRDLRAAESGRPAQPGHRSGRLATCGGDLDPAPGGDKPADGGRARAFRRSPTASIDICDPTKSGVYGSAASG